MTGIDSISCSDFSCAELSGSNISYSTFNNSDFRDAFLLNADFVGTRIISTKFDGAQLSGINLHLSKGIQFFTAGIINNYQLVHYPEFDITTFGPFQDTWDNMLDLLDDNYSNNKKILRSIHLAEDYIVNQESLV